MLVSWTVSVARVAVLPCEDFPLWLPVQAYAALLHAAVKCGETDLAIDVYSQMGREGMPRDCAIYITMVEMFVKVRAAQPGRPHRPIVAANMHPGRPLGSRRALCIARHPHG